MTVFLKTLAVSLIGGCLFSLTGLPVAWMLGPLAAVLLFNQGFRQRTAWPFALREGSQIILGYVMGRSITPDTGMEIVRQFPSMLAATTVTIAFTMLLGTFFSRLTHVPYPSCILGTVPGGLSQMVVLCDEIADSDVTVVTLMQTIRLLSVVFLVPFLVLHSTATGVTPSTKGVIFSPASLGFVIDLKMILCILVASLGGLIAKKIKLPTPYLLGSVLAIAALSLLGLNIPQMSRPLVVAAQISFGAYLGHNIKLENLGNWQKFLPFTFLSSVALIAFTFLVGYGLTLINSMDLLTAFLATAPGGMSEMAVTAIAVEANISVVTAYQMFRLLFILLAVPPFLKWLLMKKVSSKV